MTWLNLGGGLGMADVYANYHEVLREYAAEIFSGRWRIYTEFGRSLLAENARAYARVEYVNGMVATIHFGADLLLRRVYRPQDWSYPMRVLNPDFTVKQGTLTQQTIAGPLCFAGDLLGEIEAPRIEEGDIVEIQHIGAYTLSMWSRHCSRAKPAVLGLHRHGAIEILCERERHEDIVRQWQ